jgi:hypothetical protein
VVDSEHLNYIVLKYWICDLAVKAFRSVRATHPLSSCISFFLCPKLGSPGQAAHKFFLSFFLSFFGGKLTEKTPYSRIDLSFSISVSSLIRIFARPHAGFSKPRFQSKPKFRILPPSLPSSILTNYTPFPRPLSFFSNCL